MNSIWTRNIPQLFLTLLEVTVKYCSQEFIHHKPWLMDLDEKEKEILMDMLTKQMGRHPNKIETKK